MNKQKYQNSARGFTIVELLIAIVVIGVLSTLAFNSFTHARNKAKAAQIAQSFRQVERAFTAWHIAEGWSTWQTENELGFPNATYPDPSVNPQIDWIISAYPLLAENLQLHNLPARSIGQLRYDADGDVLTDPCSTSSGLGVVIQLANAKPYFELVDDMIDKGDGSCGKIVACSGSSSCIAFRLAKDPADLGI